DSSDRLNHICRQAPVSGNVDARFADFDRALQAYYRGDFPGQPLRPRQSQSARDEGLHTAQVARATDCGACAKRFLLGLRVAALGRVLHAKIYVCWALVSSMLA